MSRTRRTATPATATATPVDSTPVDSTPATPASEPTVDSTPSEPTPVDSTPASDDATPVDSTPASDDATPASEPTPDSPAVDPVDTFSAVWGATVGAVLAAALAAHSNGDAPSADVPLSAIDAVTSACRAIPTRKRGDAIGVAHGDTVRDTMAQPSAVWPAVLGASSALADACRAIGSAPAVAPEPVGARPGSLALALLALGAHAVPIDSDGATLALVIDTSAAAYVLGALGMGDGADPAGLAPSDVVRWAPGEPSDDDDAAIKRVRRVLAALDSKRAPSTGAPRAAGTGAPRTAGTVGRVAQHVTEALAIIGAPSRDSVIRGTDTATYPADGGRPSAGALGSISPGMATLAGIVRVTVDGAAGWALADSDTGAPASDDSDTGAPDA